MYVCVYLVHTLLRLFVCVGPRRGLEEEGCVERAGFD